MVAVSRYGNMWRCGQIDGDDDDGGDMLQPLTVSSQQTQDGGCMFRCGQIMLMSDDDDGGDV